MRRKYDLVDVVAAIGLVATLFGGYLLVTAADGFWQAPVASSANRTIATQDPSSGMQYLQPVLGSAILQDVLLDRKAGAALSTSAMELNRAVTESWILSTTLLSPLVLAELRAFGQDADHRARMQYVMGKSIVNQTRRGLASGVLSADQYAGEFNASLIQRAEAIGQRMHDQFESTRQATLGRSIVEAIQEEDRMAAGVQERIGRAIVQVTQAQEGFAEAKAAGQIQLASAMGAAARTDALMDRLTLPEVVPVGPSQVAYHSTATADISRGALVLACMGLIALFVLGLAFSNKREADSIPLWKLETLLQLHRAGR